MTTNGAGTADLPMQDPVSAGVIASATTSATATATATAAATTTLPPADIDRLQATVQAFSRNNSLPLLPSASYYWDPATMAPLNARSAAAVARLRAYRPPAFPLWDRLPVSRRAAVLVLLYADRRGDLRVVLTMRAAGLRNYSGHAAFPGGKADTPDETAVQIARREAWEEIGLPMDDNQKKLPPPFRIEHLCCLPHNLARTELVVRPCIALLHADGGGENVGEALIPKLDAKEVAAVFSAPFHNFLLATDELAGDDGSSTAAKYNNPPALPPGPWYEGSWMQWHEKPWRMHFFYVPVVGQRVAKPKTRLREEEEKEEDTLEDLPGRYKVWGMTARIMVDAAQLAYGEAPAFEHNPHFGDEEIIARLEKMGRLGERTKPGGEKSGQSEQRQQTHEDTKEASKM